MKLAAAFVLLICALSRNVSALDDSPGKTLADEYENKVLVLRHPVASNSQRYSAAGILLSEALEGPWTVDGALEVRRLVVSPDKMTLEGVRQIYVFDEKRKRLLPFKLKDKDQIQVTMEIVLDHPLSSREEGDAIISRIFATDVDELINSAPDYWRSFLAKQYGKQTSIASSATTLANPSEGSRSDPSPREVARINLKKDKPPKPLHTPDPEPSDTARHLKIQGTVVLSAIIDKSGSVVKPEIVRPVGAGLDEQAIAVVRTWKFSPATRKGQPLTIQMGLEVSFDHY